MRSSKYARRILYRHTRAALRYRGWYKRNIVYRSSRELHGDGDRGKTVVMGTKLAVIPGDGDQVYGNTVGIGMTYCLLTSCTL